MSIRRLGKEGQQVMPLDAALKMLAEEAAPPDVKRAGRPSDGGTAERARRGSTRP